MTLFNHFVKGKAMLAPYVIHLLSVCSLLLLVGWFGDALRNWLNAGKVGTPERNGMNAGASTSPVVHALATIRQ
jgi:hypothetical protein